MQRAIEQVRLVPFMSELGARSHDCEQGRHRHRRSPLERGGMLTAEGSYRYALTVASARPRRRAISAIGKTLLTAIVACECSRATTVLNTINAIHRREITARNRSYPQVIGASTLWSRRPCPPGGEQRSAPTSPWRARQRPRHRTFGGMTRHAQFPVKAAVPASGIRVLTDRHSNEPQLESAER